MDIALILVLINAGLAVASSIFGIKWAKGKGKINQAISVALTIMKAVEDDTITPEEEKAIVDEIRDLLPSKE